MPRPEISSGFLPFEVRPQLLAKGKTTTHLARTDILAAQIQVVANGGETNLHAHKGEDAFWLILNGRARFYTTGDELVGEYGKHEGLVISRGMPYWFESASDEALVVARVTAKAQNEEGGRIDFEARKTAVQNDVVALDAVLG
jgi:mannose-6-phosphate isomerase-like protein (cupin superfamily)